MADLTPYFATDPVVEAMKQAAVVGQADRMPRGYLGMSSIGDACERLLWLKWRWASIEKFDAGTLWRFADGHLSEDVIAARLRAIPGVMLIAEAESGGQIGFVGVKGHLIPAAERSDSFGIPNLVKV